MNTYLVPGKYRTLVDCRFRTSWVETTELFAGKARARTAWSSSTAGKCNGYTCGVYFAVWYRLVPFGTCWNRLYVTFVGYHFVPPCGTVVRLLFYAHGSGRDAVTYQVLVFLLRSLVWCGFCVFGLLWFGLQYHVVQSIRTFRTSIFNPTVHNISAQCLLYCYYY